MKKVKYILLNALVIVLVLSLTVGAAGEQQWRNVFSQDFTSSSSGNLPAENTPENTRNFSAKVNNGALEIESSNECEWVLNDTSALNASSNAKGIRVLNASQIKQATTPHVIEGVGTFDYYCGSGDTGYFVEQIGGKNAIKMFSYSRGDGVARTNNYRFAVDSGIFEDADSNFQFDIEVYVPNYNYSDRYVQIIYYTSAGTGKSLKLAESTIKNNTDSWYTWTFTVNNACLSKWITENSMQKSFAISIPGYSSTLDSSTYIHSVKIKRIEASAPEFDNAKESKTVLLPVASDSDFGSSRLAFDLTLPSDASYNTGTNSMTVSIANEDKKDVATLQIDSTDTGQVLYAVSEENGGERTKTKIYEGSILGQTLFCTMELDMKAKTYKIKVLSGDAVLSSGETAYPINNNKSGAAGSIGRYLSIKHNPRSWAMKSVIDNITCDILDSEEYLNCKADSDAITLEIGESGIVEADTLTLPTTGEHSSITWSSNSPLVTISGNTATLTHGEEDTEVSIVSTSTSTEDTGIKITREFTFTIAEHEDHKKLEEEIAALALETPQGGKYTQAFTLPVVGTLYDAASISWESLNTDVVTINGAQASLVRGEADVSVKLKATVTVGEFSDTKEITITVAEHDDHKKAVDEAAKIKLDVPETMRVKKNFALPNNAYISSWASDNAAIAVSQDGLSATVTRGQTDTTVNLTATVVVGEYSAQKTFTLTVTSVMDLYSTVEEINEVEDTTNNLLSATVDVSFPAGSGNLTFVAVSVESGTGKIRDRKTDTEDITGQIGNVTFSITNLSKYPTDTVQYYFWDDDEISAINNAPTAIKNMKTADTVKGVKLTWDESYDDNGSMEYYAIYRNNTLIGQTTQTSYMDSNITKGTEYNYKVLPVDTNDLIGGAGESKGKSTVNMYYIKYGMTSNNTYGMQDAAFSTDTARDAYAFVTQVTDANGVVSAAATTTTKYILGRTNKANIGPSDHALVFEITYLDTDGKITLSYNQIMPEGTTEDTVALARKRVDLPVMTGTNTWKTAVIRVEDAQLRESSQMSMQDFGLSCSVANNMFIKEIKIIQAHLYD